MTRHAASFALLFALVLGFVGAAGGADLEEWDQEKVTALAQKLAEDVKGLRAAGRRQPPDSLGSGQAAARHRLLDRLRVIERESAALARELAAGEGRDATLPIFERIDSLRAQAAEEARRMFLPQDAIDRIQRARATLEELRPYYTGEPAPPPGLHGPTREGGQ